VASPFLDQFRPSATWRWDVGTLSWVPWDGATQTATTGTSNVAVVNTPAVTLSGTSNVVTLTTGTASIGTVSFSGTSPVSIVGTSPVSLSGTANVVSITTGTASIGTVAVSGTSAVSLSGTANVVTLTAGTAAVGTVAVSGTHAVNLSGTANVVTITTGTAALGTVSLTGTSPVNLTGTANVVSLTTGAATIGALTANQSINLAQVAGTTTVTSASGVQKCGIVGNAGGILDGATATTVPANAFLNGLRAATANPTAVADNQMVAMMGDKYGRQVVARAPQDLWVQGRATITTTASTAIVASHTVRTAICTIAVNVTATAATRVDILDGATLVHSFDFPANAARAPHVPLNLDPPYIGTASTAVNAQASVAVTDVRVILTGFKVA
jgi:hypothetical protein